MKKLILLAVLFTLILSSNSCSIFKHNTNKTSLESKKVKTDVEVKKQSDIVKVNDIKAISENSSTVATEEISYKKAVPSSIELTATFRVDTNSSLKGDTALKLVDINNSEVSVAIYQNKKTNELMAKISTGKSTKSVPFDELQIKRTYSNTTSKVDSSKRDSASSHLTLDSTDKSKRKELVKTGDQESKPSSTGMWGLIGIVAVVGIIAGVVYLIKNKSWLK